MPNSPYLKKLKLGEPAYYRIEVQGCLNENWSGRLAGMRITIRGREDNREVTTLSGRVRDQAELMGVLNSLYELHMSLLSVEIVSKEE
jgi:hypothetical protein